MPIIRPRTKDITQGEDLNDLRASLGLSLIVKTKRRCLRCEDEFTSEGPHNRQCYNCRTPRDRLFNRKAGGKKKRDLW